MRPSLPFLPGLLASGPAAAQFTLDWAPRDDANAGLPPSIRVFESVTSGVRDAARVTVVQ